MNPAMAGLGALTKQGTQPRGMPPETMSQTMALAKKMSDMQLADVLAGKSMDVPQYVAMTEAMGRKQLRTAMQGMTAMTSAKQPTEREKLLSEMRPQQPQQTMMSVPPQGAQQGAGLDQLPADNMQGLGHADGGIIAFSGKDGRQDVHSSEKSFWDVVDPVKYKSEPGYKAFVDESDATDKTYKNYLESGNAPPLTEKELSSARHKNAFAFEDKWLNSPEGRQATIQSQQMGEPALTLPSKVNERYWTEATGEPKRGTEMAEFASGLNPGDYARMRGEQKPSFWSGENWKAETAAAQNPTQGVAALKDIATLPGRAMGTVNEFKNRLLRLGGVERPEVPADMRLDAPLSSATPYTDALRARSGDRMAEYEPGVAPLPSMGVGAPANQAAAQDIENGASQQPTTKAPGVAPPKTSAGGPGAGGGPGGGGAGGGGGYGGGLPGTELASFAEKQAELLRPKERNKDYYEALTKPMEDIAKQVASGKEQAQGEFLMQLGAKLMSVPNIGVAIGKGVEAGLPGLAASRKEINALTKDQREFQFNIAKAKEARDQGDEMLALNYLKLAEESKYHAGMVGAYMARASSDAKAWGRANITAQQGIKDWKDLRVDERQKLQQMGITPYNFAEYVNSGGTSIPTVATLPNNAQVLQLPKP
jgi:hypothetical protein